LFFLFPSGCYVFRLSPVSPPFSILAPPHQADKNFLGRAWGTFFAPNKTVYVHPWAPFLRDSPTRDRCLAPVVPWPISPTNHFISLFLWDPWPGGFLFLFFPLRSSLMFLRFTLLFAFVPFLHLRFDYSRNPVYLGRSVQIRGNPSECFSLLLACFFFFSSHTVCASSIFRLFQTLVSGSFPCPPFFSSPPCDPPYPQIARLSL